MIFKNLSSLSYYHRIDEIKLNYLLINMYYIIFYIYLYIIFNFFI